MRETLFTIEQYDPTDTPPRAPFFWLNENASPNKLFLARGTDGPSDWIEIDLDLVHPSRTDNPHSVTSSQVGASSALWNANQLKGYSLGTGYSPVNKSTLVFNASGPTVGWATTPAGQVYCRSFSSSRKYLYDALYHATLGDVNLTHDLSSDTLTYTLKPEIADLETWNANRILSVPVDHSTIADGTVLVYNNSTTAYEPQNLKSQILTYKQAYHGIAVTGISTTSQTPVALIPATAGDQDSAASLNDLGIFDDIAVPEWVLINSDCKIKFEISATMQNTTTANGVSRLVLQIADYDPNTSTVSGITSLDHSECTLVSPSTTAGKWGTVSKSGYIDLIAGQLLGLKFCNFAAVSNTIEVKASSAVLILEIVST